MPENDPLDSLLDRWDDGFKPDPLLSERVREAVAAGSEIRKDHDNLIQWLGNALSRPGLVAGFAAVFMLVGMGLSQLISSGFSSEGDELTLSYRLSIDPLYRLQTMVGAEELVQGKILPATHSVDEAPVFLEGLGWLQSELGLSEGQYQRVTELHSDYESSFQKLFVDMLESHRAYLAFDQKRMDSDVIDYFQLYELLQSQRELSERSNRLTEELLGKVERIIEPSKRARYRELLEPAYPRLNPKEKSSKTDA